MSGREHENQQTCQVLVIGGGPAGSTVSTLLARKGLQVVMLEKEHHPRFHIGESLLPMNLPVFERLGVLEKVRAIGVFKAGAEFDADNERGYNTYDFDRNLGDSPPHAFQVWRQDFDRMLFEHAREQGVDAREGATAMAVDQRGPRESWVQVQSADAHYRIRAEYVIDASGRDTMLARAKKLVRRNRKHQSAALFGHFRGAQVRPGNEAGNIGIYHFEHGWLWMIPLPDGVMSVGAVCRPDYLKQRRGDTAAFFKQTLARHPTVSARLRDAQLIDDKVRVAGNYSYDAARIGGPGWMLVGDAFAFLDPVFSSGVYLAMSSAERVADLVHDALAHPSREAALQRRLEKRLRTGMRRIAWFIHRFNAPVMQQMFRAPRNVMGVEQAVISMLAGDVFDSRPVRRRLLVFKAIHAAHVLFHLRRWFAVDRDRRAQARSRFTE